PITPRSAARTGASAFTKTACAARSLRAMRWHTPSPARRPSMHSCIYEGVVKHERFAPRQHAFSYRMFMMYLDLAELDALFRRRWFWSATRPNLAWFKR